MNNFISGKKAAALFIILFFSISQIGCPTVSYALTGGPAQPEFSSFEPVATTSMVNEFTGDFTYNLPVLNIPGPDGGGYSMSLSYHSGSGVETEASWVGLGWTLNPGAISRNKRGFADDWNGKEVKFYNKTRPNRTVTLGGGIGDLEAFSVDFPLNVNGSIRYNNYKGFGYSLGAGIATSDGLFSLGYHISDGEGSFSAQISPGALLNSAKKKKEKEKKRELIKKYRNSNDKESISKIDKNVKLSSSFSSTQALNALGNSGYGMLALANSPSPQASTPFNGSSFRLNIAFQINPVPANVSPLAGSLFGSYSTQKNVEVRSNNAYGYMYSYGAWHDPVPSVMDYDVERPSGFNRYDKVLPVPSSSIDMYSLTGEGLGGGFRMHNRRMGHYTPTRSTSQTVILSGGIDLDIGLYSGPGFDGSIGQQVLTTTFWEGNHLDDFPKHNGHLDEATFFRFTNDMGGSVGYGNSSNWNAPTSASSTNSILSSNLFHISQNNTLGNDRVRRSSYIGYNTNENIEKKTDVALPNPSSTSVQDFTRYEAYCKREDIHEFVNREENSKQIGEFSVVNEAGSSYNYGLPVYTRKEENIMIDIKNVQPDDFIQSNYIVKRKVNTFEGEVDVNNETTTNSSKIRSVVGQYAEDPYASSYLLTSITTSDYIDRTNDGPTNDDFGGFTKFNYKKVTSELDWYRFRSPYIGLNYARNSFSDPKDDMAGYNSGERELYYLESIETKSHIAYFVKSFRNDGIEASGRTNASQGTINLSVLTKQMKLDKIVLHRKKSDGTTGKELQTTYFEYDYSTQSGGGLLNSISSSLGDGKLTLKKVWTEYNDVYSAKIAPVIFDYEYPDFDYSGLGEGLAYEDFQNHANGTNQTAGYDPRFADAWGNYQKNTQRYDNYQRWNDQSNAAKPNINFDPAMWQLKRISLPSGGEIHVQYEQDDYAYVQHEVAHALVSLDESDIYDTFYTLNLNDVGITNPIDIIKYADQIKDMYVGTGKKMFFKFFYKLVGASKPELNDCKSDFISGYVDIADVLIDGDNKIHIIPSGNVLPREVCANFVKTQRAGMLTNSGCNPQEDQNFSDSDVVAVVTNFINFGLSFLDDDRCAVRNESLSYLRIPVFRGIRNGLTVQGKRGGGIRVKRILMFDDGIVGGKKSLYGTEYSYITKDFEGNYISSGVATNEPGASREENPMVTFMERAGQSLVNKIIAGKDKKQLEGPIGENLMPSPSIGYSRIISKNIHSGKTHTGYTVKEFYTAYNCPFYYSENLADPIDPTWAINRGTHLATEIDNNGTQFPLSIPLGVVNISSHTVKATQGFNFALNNMHGQVKGSAQFANLYKTDAIAGQLLKEALERIEDENTLVSSEFHEYFNPGEKIPTKKTPYGEIEFLPLGQEQDVCFETKEIKDQTISTGLEVDYGVSILGVVIYNPTASPSFTLVKNKISTHVTSKVTNYPAIEKRVISYQDGVYHTSLNQVFDYNTGKPVVTQTFDDFITNEAQDNINSLDYISSLLTLQGQSHDASLVASNYTAPMVYDEMGQKSAHEGLLVRSQFDLGGSSEDIYSSNIFNMATNGSNQIIFTPSSPEALCAASKMFPPGSTIQLETGFATDEDIYHVDKFEDGIMHILPVSYSTYTNSSEINIDIKIIRSGRTNQLTTPIGNVVVYGSSVEFENNTSVPPGTLTSMEGFANLLTSNIGSSISSNEIQNASSSFSLFVDNQCQEFPAGCEVSNYDGLLSIICSEFQPSAFNLSCDEISPFVVDYLNQYWESFLMPVDIPITNEYCKFELDDSYWHFTQANMVPDELSVLENSIFEKPVHPLLGSTGTPCDKFVKDYFKPIHRNVPKFSIIKETTSTGLETNRISEIIIKDLALNQYYVIIAKCMRIHNIEEVAIYYGVTDNPNIENVSFDPITLPTLERITFSPTANLGNFFSGSSDCMYLKYPDDNIPSTNHQTTISEVSTLGLNCSTTEIDTICSTDLTNGGMYDGTSGTFGVDNSTGYYNLVYYPFGPSCDATFIDVGCLNFCDYSHYLIEDVIASSFTTFDDKWDYNKSIYASNSSEEQNYLLTNPFETGERGKWRPKASYVYSEDRGILNDYETLVERNYNSGVYDLLLFDWNNPTNYEQYKEVSTVTKYSPNGNTLEEKNILGIRSTAKYGYNHLLPYLVAKNSDYSSVLFESFENIYENQYLEDGFLLDNEVGVLYTQEAHSGNQCLKLIPNNDGLFLLDIIEGGEMQKQGGILKLWLKSDRVDRQNIGADLKCRIINTLGDLDSEVSFVEIARSGDWGLYELAVPQGLGNNFKLYLRYQFDYPNENIMIDDMRLQPKNAQLNTYVYDVNTFNLIASFDDQNFGLFYQYNGKGKLVRKLKETVRGVKTIKETQYNVPKNVILPW